MNAHKPDLNTLTDSGRPELDLTVLDGIDLSGGSVNTADLIIRANIAHSIRLGFPQVKPQEIQPERVLLVGGGPSLKDTEQELIDLYFAGAKIFTVNGAYHWCIERNLRPSAQIVVDARDTNGRFLTPAIPECRYLIASQCAPATWDVVNDGRDHVWIWHAVIQDEAGYADVLNPYYFGNWTPVGGGTTVAMRALSLLRTMGFVRFDLFGIDSCWMGGAHHAFPQPENEADPRIEFKAWPTGCPDHARTFLVSPWHLKQLEDFLQLIRVAGDAFLINVHGDGLLSFALNEAAEFEPASLAAKG